MRKLLIAGGGTGGHLFPGIAVAKVFMAKNQDNKVLFVSAGNAFELKALSLAGFNHQSIDSEGIKGRGLWQKLRGMMKIPKSIAQSLLILFRFKPDAVLGVGGYSSGPVLIAAWLMFIPIIIQEQNSLPGITNRILAWFVNRIYLSFESSERYFSRFLSKKFKVVGNPVREEILSLQPDTLKDKRLVVLISGGSQGAHAINTAVADSLQYLENKDQFFFIHQSGTADEAVVRDAYEQHKTASIVKAFFEDMGTLYHQADLIICRAGATTIAEITAVGKAAIFIPFPFAADNHQVFNAKSLLDHHAAGMILEKDLNGKMLAEKIGYYASYPEKLKIMAKNAKTFGKPEAAKLIVEDIYDICGSQN